MTYEVVQLNAKTIVGLQARSSNTDPHMGEIIGDLWERLYAGLYEAIPGKVNGKSIGLYTGYAGDSYDVVVGCEAVPGEALPAGVVQAVIPAGPVCQICRTRRCAKGRGRFLGKAVGHGSAARLHGGF